MAKTRPRYTEIPVNVRRGKKIRLLRTLISIWRFLWPIDVRRGRQK